MLKLCPKTIVMLLLLASGALRGQTADGTPVAYHLKTADSLFQLQKWGKAKSAYLLALSDTSNNSLAWNRLGYCNFNLRLYAEAIKSYQKSILQKPAPQLKPVVYMRLARVYAVLKKNEQALSALDSAVTSGYSNCRELDTLSAFNPVRNSKEFKQLKQQTYLNANPCMSDKQARAFDFWVGEWNVYITNTTQYAGHSLIQIIAGGCALLENWESPNSNGKSINFIDPVTNKWKQSWAGNYPNGIQEFVNGEYKDNAMRFTFESIDAKGQKTIGRFIFYNQGPDQVRQFNESSSDGGATWITNYDLTYKRKK